MNELILNRKTEIFKRDPRRIVAKFFGAGSPSRMQTLVEKILRLDDAEVDRLLSVVVADFKWRHRELEAIYGKHFDQARGTVGMPELKNLPESRKLLIGAYFTHEYAIESAALFNPSIVIHPDHRDGDPDSMRFVMSLRATGEGHISSIVFRTGQIDAKHRVHFDVATPYSSIPDPSYSHRFSKPHLKRKLDLHLVPTQVQNEILALVGESFEASELLDRLPQHSFNEALLESLRSWLTYDNYQVKFDPDSPISERVLFPFSSYERNGLEDARFVTFTDDDGSRQYYATYTGFDGTRIFPMLLNTQDFCSFEMRSLEGKVARDKGMALFPRKIHGKYAMVSRQDGENLYYMESDDIHFWNEKRQLNEPRRPWELIQIGNCGSPIETKHGWILLTHGVGPMRKYSISVELLDLDEPWRVIGKLGTPLLEAEAHEREGYVPNVIYTCGGVAFKDTLIIPYAASDISTGLAIVDLDGLIQELKKSKPS